MGHVKKIILMALSAVMVIAATAYGKENKEKEETTNSDALIGKWICYFFGKDGVKTIALQFNKDGSCVGSSSGKESDKTFSWTLKGTALTISVVEEKKDLLASFDGETIVVRIGSSEIGPFIKEGDKGLGEEASRKKLIGTWKGSSRDDGKGETYTYSYVFGEDGNGTLSIESICNDGRPAEKKSEPFTWTLTGVKLVIKSSIDNSNLTTYYNGEKVLNLGLMCTKQ